MLFSKTCEYAIRATLFMAMHHSGEFISIRKIADEVNIPYHFLTKILQHLTRADILESSRGPQGGVKIKGQVDEIKLINIIYAVDGADIFEQCVIGLPGCGVAKPCPFHDQWIHIRSLLHNSLDSSTLSDLVRKILKNDLRISETS